MSGVARGFFTAALIYGVLGMGLGLYMAISHSHVQLPTHAHIMVIGWLSFAVFGLFYSQFEQAAANFLSVVHLWLAQLAMIGLAIGLGLIYAGKTEFEPIPAVSSIAYALSFLLFAYIALPVVWTSSKR